MKDSRSTEDLYATTNDICIAVSNSLDSLLSDIVYSAGHTLIYNMRHDEKLIGLHHELLGLKQHVDRISDYLKSNNMKV